MTKGIRYWLGIPVLIGIMALSIWILKDYWGNRNAESEGILHATNQNQQTDIGLIKEQVMERIINTISNGVFNNNMDLSVNQNEMMGKWVEDFLENESKDYDSSLANKISIYLLYGNPEDNQKKVRSGGSQVPIQQFGIETDGNWWIRAEVDESAYSSLEGLSGAAYNKKFNEKLLDAPRYAVLDFSHIEDTTLINPTSLNLGIEKSIPFTYNATIEQGAVYVESLRFDGWNIVEVDHADYYVDYVLEKNGAQSRVIMLDGSLKVFYWGTQE